MDFAERIHAMRALDLEGGRDHCLLVPGLPQYANTHELLALVAPRPLLIIGSPIAAGVFE